MSVSVDFLPALAIARFDQSLALSNEVSAMALSVVTEVSAGVVVVLFFLQLVYNRKVPVMSRNPAKIFNVFIAVGFGGRFLFC